MKIHSWVFALAGYMVLMGITGFLRTGSYMPILLNGGIALIAAALGYYWGRSGSRLSANLVLGWVAAIRVLMTYMTFHRPAAHSQTRVGSEFIFGSMAVFAIIVLIQLVRHRLRR